MYESIVVGTDGSGTASEAVRRAAELASDWGAALHLVSAHTPHKAKVAAGTGQEAAQAVADPDYKVDAILDKAVDLAKSGGIEPKLHAPRGDPADALIRVAQEQGADLIVVGNRGMTGARRLLGSVPNKVTHHAPCSVLVVHTA
ncbi:MAG TPA: universal stress protein [Thermoleophilaceae bacterium]|jgi:nucleotide-binding universal stress UspA family protein